MKILLVSYFFPPTNVIGAVRVGKLAKFLLEAGNEVRVLAANESAFPKGLKVEVPEEIITRTDPIQVNAIPYRVLQRGGSANPQIEEARPGWLGALGNVYRTLFNFPDGQIGWYPSAVKEGNAIIKAWKPDIIYASAMPFTSLLIAKNLSKKWDVPYVGELRDLWVDGHYYDHPGPRKWLEGILERSTLSRASHLVTVSEPLAKVLRKKYGKPTSVVLNGFDPTNLPSHLPAPSGKDAAVRIVYTGIIYPGRRDPSALFEALRRLGKERRHIKVEFYGRTLSSVRQLAKKYGIEDVVELHAPISFQESINIQNEADILLLLLWNSPSEAGVYTGKLFEYLGARRPILMIGLENGAAADLIRDRNAGIVSNDANALAAQLKTWQGEKRNGGIRQLPESVALGLSRAEQFSVLNNTLHSTVPRALDTLIDIVIVINQLGMGGTEQHLAQVLSRLDRRRFKISIWTLRSGGALEEKFRTGAIEVISPPHSVPRAAQRLWVFLKLLLRIRRVAPDIIHCYLPEAYIVGGIAGVIGRHRSIIMSRRNLNAYQRHYPFLARVEKWLHRHISAVTGNSKAVVSQLHEETSNHERVGLIYNGLDFSQFDKASPREEVLKALELHDGTLLITTVANLIPYKGYRDLLLALAEIKLEFEGAWVLLCIGRDDGIGQELQNLCRELKLHDNVKWLGERHDVTDILNASDIGVLCSHEEGFSNSILEGMAAGLPMVVTNAGGNSEAVINNETGFVVPISDPPSIASAIRRLSGDPDLRARMGRAGQVKVKDAFSIDSCVDSYVQLYTLVHEGKGNEIGKILPIDSETAIPSNRC